MMLNLPHLEKRDHLTITKSSVKLPRKMLPTNILSDKPGHPDSMYPSNNDLPHDKTDLGINDSTVDEPKRNTQKSPVLL